MRQALLVLLVIAAASGSIAHADPATERPEQPSRAAVIAAINAVQPAVSACGRGGEAHASILFGPDGRVASVTVRGSVGGASVEGTPVGECIAAAVRTTVVPPFRRESFVVNYPFRL